MSTYPSEIVQCQWTRDVSFKVICKYGPARVATGFGHRGGVSYEARIYSRVLDRLALSTPQYYGTLFDRSTNSVWLILQFLDNSIRIKFTPDAHALLHRAARWIGDFHNKVEQWHTAFPSFFIVYDSAYYQGWASRALEFSERLRLGFPWLTDLCLRCIDALPTLLLNAPVTLIHGEYYPANILTVSGRIAPIDWESAAIGPGEIDLATLTDGWPESSTHSVVLAYQAARWPEGAPAGFHQRFHAARLYVHLRWLGDPKWSNKISPRRLELMRESAGRLRLI